MKTESVVPPLRFITYPSTSDPRDHSDPTPFSRPAEDGSCTVRPMSIRVFVCARVLNRSATQHALRCHFVFGFVPARGAQAKT